MICLMSSLLHFPQNLSQILGHVVGSLQASIISLKILQEAEKQGIHSHSVDTKEGTGNQVASNHNEHNWGEVVVQIGNLPKNIFRVLYRQGFPWLKSVFVK